MTRTRRNFTPEERLSILQKGEREGHSIKLKKYQIAPSLYARWKHKYLKEGNYGLKDKHKRVNPALRELELENERGCLSDGSLKAFFIIEKKLWR